MKTTITIRNGIAPRRLFDLEIGHYDIFHCDKYKWNARITIVNLMNQYVLYNFLSTFSGTHYVTPRPVLERSTPMR